MEPLLHIGLEGERLSDRQVGDKAGGCSRVLWGHNAGAGGDRSGDPFGLGAGNHRRLWTRGAGGQPAVDGGVETAQAQE